MKTNDINLVARLAVSLAKALNGTEPNAPKCQTPLFNPDWLAFSPLEVEVLKLLCESGPLTKQAIGSKLDRSPEAQLKDILANLGARRVIASGQDGYDINLPGDRVQALLEWLVRQHPEPQHTRESRRLRPAAVAAQDDGGALSDEQLAERIAAARAARANGVNGNGKH